MTSRLVSSCRPGRYVRSRHEVTVVRALDDVPPMLRRVLVEETLIDVAALASDERQVLG